MQRKQKTNKMDCPCKGMLETDSSKGAQSMTSLGTATKNRVNLLEIILSPANLNEAYLRVKRKKGAAGVDGMKVDEMYGWLKEHKEEFLESLKNGKYKPQPVRRVEIPKPDGGKRKLGIPTVLDGVIQQAIMQVLQPIFEQTFSDNSYGFRPGKSAHLAIKQAEAYYKEGYTKIVDLDLAQYFDTVNHDMLINMLREEIQDERAIALIRKYLKSGVMEGGIISPTMAGTPQGGNLSPLLSNIYLTKFDKLLESRGHKFVRYADDCNIYVKTPRAAKRVMESCINYLEGKLKLKVNRKKSKIGSPLREKFLGFSLHKVVGKIGIRPHQNVIRKFKQKVKEITGRSRGRSIESILLELKNYTIGWLNYFSISDMRSRIQDLNQWIRRRLRMYLWKQWKKISARFKNLNRLGLYKGKAWEYANTRLGYWRIANSPILGKTLTDKYLESLGYMNIAKKYEMFHSR
ncbi:group II intron reverse transcriptase/maturase [Pectinatus sottacetonis]|uniref:group II intron reverse transcriptase/maturase n=1 Tax=Pectinatus sottacetonis TaxID=1002795 RepID=UPI001E5DBD88|nr:group II intron reverse transcriptase/maturase [Pectinatus sottacetonis]